VRVVAVARTGEGGGMMGVAVGVVAAVAMAVAVMMAPVANVAVVAA
jgi:hypothetical protein